MAFACFSSTRTRQRFSLYELEDRWTAGDKKPLEDVWRAFRAIQQLPADDPDSFFTIGGFHVRAPSRSHDMPLRATRASTQQRLHDARLLCNALRRASPLSTGRRWTRCPTFRVSTTGEAGATVRAHQPTQPPFAPTVQPDRAVAILL